MGKAGSRLVEALIRCVQIAIERMGFGQGVVCDVCSEGRGVVDVSTFKRCQDNLATESIALARWHDALSKRHPFPPPPTVALAGLPRNFFSLFQDGGFYGV